MKTPKQRLIAIVEEDSESSILNMCKMLYLTEEQVHKILELSREQELAAEIVTNTFTLDMTEEELKAYVEALELIRSKSATLQETVVKVMQSFTEHNIETIKSFQEDNQKTLN